MHPGYFPVFFWSLAIFASFWGFGELLRRWLNRREFDDIGWGLTAAWGMAVVLALGGLLMAAHMAKAASLIVLVLLGIAFAIYFALKRLTEKPQPSSSVPPAFPISNFILFALALLAFASSIAWPLQVDPNDDVVCYLFFPKKILETGTLIEPFNFRRLGTYGGQALLQALVMIVGGERNGHVPDRGFGMLMIFGMLLHVSRGIPKRLFLLRFFAVGALFFVSVPRINTGSHLTSGAMILGLILTLSKLTDRSPVDWKKILVPSLLLAGTGSFRMTYFLCATGILTFEPIARNWASMKSPVDALGKAMSWVVPAGLLTLLFLAPWMLVFWQSNGTPMFPPFSGTINSEFTILGNKNGRLFDAAHALAYLLTPEALSLIILLGLAWFSINKPLAYTAAIVAVVVSWLVSCKLGVGIFQESYRYTFPMLMCVGAWLVVSTLADCKPDENPKDATVILSVVLVLGLFLAVSFPNAGRELSMQIESLPQQIASRDRLVNPALTNADRELQNYTPVGSKIFAAVDTPYGFDFARNEIYTADFPGGSAIGKWPLRQGAGALERYLTDHGFQYIIASDFDNAMLLYTRKHWKEHQRPEWFFKEINGKYFLDFMDNVDEIAKNGRVIATSANLRLIELNKHPSP